MPELPEVETVRRDLIKYLVGRRFFSTKIYDFKNVAPGAAFLARYLKGAKVLGLRRRGKLLIIDLDKEGNRDRHLLIHLKMTGQLVYRQGKDIKAGGHSLGGTSISEMTGGFLPNKHTRAVFAFEGGAYLYFNDLRKFGYIKLSTDEELEKIISAGYGPEPGEKEFSVSYLSSILKRKAPVKAVILNQKLIAGLGNIYADESLFAAKIDPSRSASSLKDGEIRELHRAIVNIIRKAVKARGTTFRNYVDAFGKKGKFSSFLNVYQRSGQKCPRCGRKILKKRVAGRGTHYCAHCQR
ncbi:MAG: bifunctional DNA-formamidopyrimidine glycosylase/DNA-(apurinic or apyrimidinic site) lyase [Bacillota bacterium]